MTFSFKKFVELVDREELTEEQLDEIFGVFATTDKKQQDVAAQKKSEFQARRDALRKKATGQPADDEGEEDPRKVPAIKPRKTATTNRPAPGTPRTAFQAGRQAERDWLSNMEAADTGKTVKRLARQHAMAVINNGDNKEPVLKIEVKIKALPNGAEALRHVKAASRKWVGFAEANPDEGVSKEDMKKVDAIIAKAIEAVSKPV